VVPTVVPRKITTPNNNEPTIVAGRFLQKTLDVFSNAVTANSEEDNSTAITPIALPNANYNSYLQEETTDSSVPPSLESQQKNAAIRTAMQTAITTLNAGLFIQNTATMVRSMVLAQLPQSFSVFGSGINLVSLFLPSQFKLPAFVLGLSTSMGGAALALSQSRRCAVDRVAPTLEAFKQVSTPAWKGSAKLFPYEGYMHYKNGEAYSSFHLIHPGALATMARTKYDTVFNELSKTMFTKREAGGMGLPRILSFIPDLAAGAYQLAWMNGKMLTDWGFAYDALRPIERSEFVRGSRYTMPNAPEYALAIGAVAPLALMGAALGVESMQKAHNKLEAKFDPTKPVEQQLSADGTKPTKPDALFQKASPLQLAANISAIIPSLANLMFIPAIEVASGGNPLYSVTKGTNFFYKATPQLDATLMKVGSIGSIVTALTSSASGLGLLPKSVADTSDLAFLSFSALSSVGNSRNTMATESRTTQAEHLNPAHGQHENIIHATNVNTNSWAYQLKKFVGLAAHETQIPTYGVPQAKPANK